MAQNVYDRPDFFAAYDALPRSIEGLAGAAEWPALRAMLPPMAGLRVLDLGCGFGWFCRWAREAGAVNVLGVDLSRRMLARAAEMTRDEAIRYERADLDSYRPPAEAFDLAFSSLALHYVVDVDRLFAAVRAALAPGGRLVLSTEHPILTAPPAQQWTSGPDGGPVWPLAGYAREGERRTDWLAPGIVKQHRRVATTLNALVDAGFVLERMIEWAPSPNDVAAHPEWEREMERPMFLLLSARL